MGSDLDIGHSVVALLVDIANQRAIGKVSPIQGFCHYKVTIPLISNLRG